MRTRLKQLLRPALAPLLHWFAVRLDALQAAVGEIAERQGAAAARQDELVVLNRAVVEQRDAEHEVLGRTLAAQRTLLESVEAQQRALTEQVRALRDEVARLEHGRATAEPER